MGWQPQEEWSDDQVKTASKMWREGCSASLIAMEIGKSRSAVVGKANRNRSLFPARMKATQTARGMAKPRPTRAPSAPAMPGRIDLPSSAELLDDLAAFREPRATPVRSISCQAVALTAPIEEITRAVRLGILPEDAAPIAYDDDAGACRCRWPVGKILEIDLPAEKACGAPVLDPASRIGMARTHCGFHFRAAGQDIAKVLG